MPISCWAGHPHQQRGRGDDAFRQGRAEGSQQRTGCTLGQFEMMAGPFDAVDEVFAGQIDGDGRDRNNSRVISMMSNRQASRTTDGPDTARPAGVHIEAKGLAGR